MVDPLLRAMLVVLLLAQVACAPLPARCARPVGEPPPAPPTHEERRVVATLNGATACEIKVHLPDGIALDQWPAERDAALATALSAARSCCAHPRAENLSAWPRGTSAFTLDFSCGGP